MTAAPRLADRTRPSAKVLRALLALVALAAPGCGSVAGSDPHAGMTAYAAPSGRWRLWYLAPPWEVVESRAGHLVMRVPPAQNDLEMGGAAGGLVGLVADEVSGAEAATWVADRVAAARGIGATVTEVPRSTTGGTGRVTEATMETLNGASRIAALPLPGGRVLTLVFTSATPLGGDADVSQMLALVEAAPAAGP